MAPYHALRFKKEKIAVSKNYANEKNNIHIAYFIGVIFRYSNFFLFESEGMVRCHKNRKHNNRRVLVLALFYIAHIYKNIGMHLPALVPPSDIRIADR